MPHRLNAAILPLSNQNIRKQYYFFVNFEVEFSAQHLIKEALCVRQSSLDPLFGLTYPAKLTTYQLSLKKSKKIVLFGLPQSSSK